MTADTVKFAIGQMVTHRADQNKGVVTGIVFRKDSAEYLVTFSSMQADSRCYECEIEKAREEDFSDNQ